MATSMMMMGVGSANAAGGAFSPITAASWDAFYDGSLFYSDNGTTLAGEGDTVQLGKNLANPGTRDLSQSTSGARAVYHLGANGKPYLTFNGSKYYDALTIPCTAGLLTAHLLRFTNVGYHNVYDNAGTGGLNTMLWVDGSGKLELNADGPHAAGPYNDGVWRSVITHTQPFGQPSGNRIWIDGSLVVDTAGTNVNLNTAITLFSRSGGTAPYKGDCGPFGFGSFDPSAVSATFIADLTAWMLAQAPT